MGFRRHCFYALLSLLLAPNLIAQTDANRLTYLSDFCDPYYPTLSFAKLTTPQWVGDTQVQAVVTLGIDDMREIGRYETYLRPILERLKQIDGRAPVSIMTNSIDPKAAHLQTWLSEGLSIEAHTADHPCPCLQNGSFADAKSTYDRNVDQIFAIPRNQPVAFRFPCMDSMNTPSPRVFAEIINKKTDAGNFLQASSSVLVLLNANDPELPQQLLWDRDGRARFEKYVPFRSFVNKIENYPYPYLIGGLCWEFPVAVPDDWQGQNLQGPANPETTADIKAVIDATVIKKGMANITFHPADWIRNDQMASVVDHVAKNHGDKVLFLNFQECLQRIKQNLLAGQSIRRSTGDDNGVRLVDLNADGFLDVCISNENLSMTRVWKPDTQTWHETSFPTPLIQVNADGEVRSAGVQFGIVQADGHASMLVANDTTRGGWHFDGQHWIEDPSIAQAFSADGQPILTARQGHDHGVRLRDLDYDGCCELIVGNSQQSGVWRWRENEKASGKSGWQRTEYRLPGSARIVNSKGQDAGMRFVDLNEDRLVDVIFSNENHSAIHLFESIENGWTREVKPREQENALDLPVISRNGTNNGVWFAERHMWVQNELTNRLPDGVDRRSFIDLLGNQDPRPKSPAASLSSIRVADGFRVELVAAEPLVQDPIAFDWGPDGKLWVVEMADYPLGLNNDGTPGGRIRCLEDTNGDGRYDQSTVFLEGLSYPSGVMPWRDGVLVSAAPKIIYAVDTNGDGKADRQETLYQGFVEGNQQHLVNGFARGLDHWIYVANGDSGGRIQSLKTGETIDISGRDLRIRPHSGELDAQTGQTQFGRRRDDWGNWFSCTNSAPFRHIALQDHYTRRNPHHASPSALETLADTQNTRLYPISKILSHWEGYRTPQGDEPHLFTSSSGSSVYRDDRFGPRFANSIFTCEPVHNLIHRQILDRRGTTFQTQRSPNETHSEFLVSSDSWFRPTTVRTGPDGALWISDMYRLVIEHTAYIDDQTEKTLDLRAGEEKGRIYRVVPIDSPDRPLPKLNEFTVSELAEALDSPNGWQRDMVQSLLVQSDPAVATPVVNEQLGSPKPLTRLHALCTLDGLETLTPAQLVKAMNDSHPGVRQNAIRIAEAHLESSMLTDKLVAYRLDDDPAVLMQLAFTLGESSDNRAGKTLGQLLVMQHEDRYLVSAVLSSLNERNVSDALTVLLSAEKNDFKQVESILNQVIEIAAAYGQTIALQQAFDDALKPDLKSTGDFQQLTHLLKVAGRHDLDLVRSSNPETRHRFRQLTISAETIAQDPAQNSDARLAAVRFLVCIPAEDPSQRMQILTELLEPRNGPSIQSAVIESFSQSRNPMVASELLSRWTQFSPSLRDQAVELLLTRKSWTETVIQQIKSNQFSMADLTPSHQQRLLLHTDETIRKATEAFLKRGGNPDRQAIIQQYRAALAMEGKQVRGREVFMKHCASCHQLHDFGHAVGPDLSALKNRSAEAFLIAILDPNRSIEDKYRSYTAVTHQGQFFTGILASETGNSLTLQMQEGKQQVILRRDIDELNSSNVSLMPEGLENEMSKESMADLLAFVSHLGPPPKPFPGNEPQIIVGREGAMDLPASACRIFGTTLVFETQYGNLGFWQSPDDRAAWSIEVPKSGVYDVLMTYACDNGTAGNPFVVDLGSGQITGVVSGTGTWDDYRETLIGRVQLEAGSQEVVFQSGDILKNCLLDLRSLKIRAVDAK